jgi:dTDP-4-amino-4,6-dideoxygalactose transaminase
MIPRYAPTYTYSDLLRSLIRKRQHSSDHDLRCRLATLHNVKHVFLLGSARVALYALLKAYNRPGGVLMPAYTCIVVPEAVGYAGYYPVFADIDYRSLNMTSETMKKPWSSDVTVILATHLFGIPWDIKEIMHISQQHRVLVVEDAAAALGAVIQGRLVPSFGDAAVISFHSTKVLSGETGGALLVRDDDLAYKVECLVDATLSPRRSWDLFTKAAGRKMATSSWAYSASHFGYRALFGESMYEVVAPHTEIAPKYLTSCSRFSRDLVSIQLDRLDWNLSRRRRIAGIYQDGLSRNSRLLLPVMPENCSPGWIQFPIMVEDKLAFYKHMQRNGVDVSWSYRYSCADSFGLDGFPSAQRAAKTVLGLPTYPSLTDENAQYICDVARKYPGVKH